MRYAHARSRVDDLLAEPPALRAVPDDLTPEERRDWQRLAERRHQRERTEQAEAHPRRPAASAAPTRRTGAPIRSRGEDAPAAVAQAAAPPASPAEAASASHAEAPSVTPRRSIPAPRRPAPAERSAPAPRAARVDPAPIARKARRRRLPWAGVAAGPDRLALWAVVLCLFMALVAAATARGSEPAADDRAAAPGAPAAEQASPQRP